MFLKPDRFKIVTVGNSGVGKTSIILRIEGCEFVPKTIEASLGANYISHEVSRNNHRILLLNLWDTAGQERFRSMVSLYTRNARGAIVVYDITNRQSFYDVPIWLREVRQGTDKVLETIVIIGNKCELNDKRKVSVEEGKKLAKDLGAEFFETSANENAGIDKFLRFICRQVLNVMKRDAEIEAKSRSLSLADSYESEPDDNKCCRLM